MIFPVIVEGSTPSAASEATLIDPDIKHARSAVTSRLRLIGSSIKAHMFVERQKQLTDLGTLTSLCNF
jgi:hypothetical protein